MLEFRTEYSTLEIEALRGGRLKGYRNCFRFNPPKGRFVFFISIYYVWLGVFWSSKFFLWNIPVPFFLLDYQVFKSWLLIISNLSLLKI